MEKKRRLSFSIQMISEGMLIDSIMQMLSKESFAVAWNESTNIDNNNNNK